MTIALALAAFISVCLTAWALLHRPAWPSVAFYLPLAALVLFSSSEMLGMSKPRMAEWRDMDEVEISAYRFDEGVAIYLWVMLPDERAPRAYSIPWDLQTAKKLREAADGAGEIGGRLMGKLPYETSLEDRRGVFYPEPQPAMPEKDRE